jgi:hypothetical protein
LVIKNAIELGGKNGNKFSQYISFSLVRLKVVAFPTIPPICHQILMVFSPTIRLPLRQLVVVEAEE